MLVVGIILVAGLLLALFLQPGFLRPVDGILGVLDDVFERLRNRRAGDGPLALFLLAPSLTIITLFGFVPLLFAVYMSLFEVRHGIFGPFVGLGNYVTALDFSNKSFWNSVFVTVYYAVGTVPTTMALSFLVATFLFRVVRGRGLFRTAYFLPYVTSAVAAAMVWRTILNPQTGLANAGLEALGLEPQKWLLEPRGVFHLISGGRIPHSVGPSLALCCVMAFEIWHSSGFMIVIFLAALSAMPREFEEAARIDGANWFQITTRVTIPLLSPTIFFLLVVSVIKSFQAFNGFYALTDKGHGPLDTTQNLTIYIYTTFYELQRTSYGATVATLLCCAIVVLTVVQWRFVGRRVHYQ